MKITDTEMRILADYMNWELREELHSELAPCSNEKFIMEYLKRDPEFEMILKERDHTDVIDLYCLIYR